MSHNFYRSLATKIVLFSKFSKHVTFAVFIKTTAFDSSFPKNLLFYFFYYYISQRNKYGNTCSHLKISFLIKEKIPVHTKSGNEQ